MRFGGLRRKFNSKNMTVQEELNLEKKEILALEKELELLGRIDTYGGGSSQKALEYIKKSILMRKRTIKLIQILDKEGITK